MSRTRPHSQRITGMAGGCVLLHIHRDGWRLCTAPHSQGWLEAVYCSTSICGATGPAATQPAGAVNSAEQAPVPPCARWHPQARAAGTPPWIAGPAMEPIACCRHHSTPVWEPHSTTLQVGTVETATLRLQLFLPPPPPTHGPQKEKETHTGAWG